MTTPTLYGVTGLSIQAWTPTIDVGAASYVPRGRPVDLNLAERIAPGGYRHEIIADGGYWSAAITLTGELSELEGWFANGLNRHIEVYNPSFVLVFEGFVNMLSLSSGSLMAVRGPLMDISNRVSVVYTPTLDPATSPPIEGAETTTTIEDDATSQTKYGILEAVVNGGKLLDDGTTDDAAQMRRVYLEENKDPQTSGDIDLFGGEAATLTIDILGYVHRLNKYIYEDATMATIQVDTEIQNIITGDPNGLFSTDISQIATNGTITSRYEYDNRTAWTVLQEDVALGDTAFGRYTLGIYNDRRAYYAAIPTTAAYTLSIIGNDVQAYTFEGHTPVDPWDIKPARWVFLRDFLVGQEPVAALRQDPRYQFIETVSYDAPYGLNIQGQKVSRLPQLMTRLSG